ncbi:MAG: DUF4416 family protein [Deltaproteobacteria bacterium]|nr:MAG: DUF4416 family protein [Deltaproteobacteria bacterium]
MGKSKEAQPAKLFMSLIASGEEALHLGVEELAALFGEIDFMSGRFPFHFTNYYEEEMGPALFRHFVTFKELIPIPRLPEIKETTNCVEERLAGPGGKRRINIDPGYLCLQHVILGTTKGYTHRPYLRNGIYADLTLIYRDKSFRPLEWTYPDYREDDVIGLFNQLRRKYAEDLKEGATQR